MKEIYGFIQTTRFLKSLGVASLLAFFSGSIFYGLNALLFNSFSFAFNDFIDAEKDTVGHPNRAIPSGKITRRESFFISIVLLIVGVASVIYFSSEYLTGFLTIYVLTIIYSLILKPNLAILATPVHSWSIAILFIQPFSKNIILYLAIASIVYGYEMILDYRDKDSDKQFCRTPTMANILGKGTYVLSVFAELLGVCLIGWAVY